MGTPNKPHSGLRAYRLFLAFFALVLLGLTIQCVVWVEQSRKEFVAMKPGWMKFNPFHSQVADAFAWLVPDLAMLFMFLLLAVGRPRLSNQNLHTLCRVVFSLTLTFGLVYWPAWHLHSQIQFDKEIGPIMASQGPHSLRFKAMDIYVCSTKDTEWEDGSLNICRTVLTREMFSFIAGFLVVGELVFAGIVGEIGIQGSAQ